MAISNPIIDAASIKQMHHSGKYGSLRCVMHFRAKTLKGYLCIANIFTAEAHLVTLCIAV